MRTKKLNLGSSFEALILKALGASSLQCEEVIQELWSGYGQIQRIQLTGSAQKTVVVKYVSMPSKPRHPRGWTSNLSHERKVFSYAVETHWYRSWSSRCDERCRVPRLWSSAFDVDEVLLILEDLDGSGYPVRRSNLERRQIELCLEWLAEFHASFLGDTPTGLWTTGTYWHLETRPEELNALTDQPLKQAAKRIDQILSQARYQTIVHGDAKLANFCFSETGDRVAAVDFQYVGGGCGMKDVAYFLGSCLEEADCEEQEAELLACYFECLSNALKRRRPDIDTKAVESEWRELFPFAWTDFHRFLKGWCPSHWKINSYSERLARETIERLERR